MPFGACSAKGGGKSLWRREKARSGSGGLEDLAMRKPVMERHIAKTVIQILRERLVELETLKATGAAPEDTVRRLAFVRKLLVQFDATASRLEHFQMKWIPVRVKKMR
jgi:hypothetical protein